MREARIFNPSFNSDQITIRRRKKRGPTKSVRSQRADKLTPADREKIAKLVNGDGLSGTIVGLRFGIAAGYAAQIARAARLKVEREAVQ